MAPSASTGAGQYFTPRALIQAMVDCIAPRPGELICDPACGTGGFLFTAHHYLTQHNPNLTRDEKRHLKEGAFRGWELVQATARVCAMNLMLHGIGSEKSVPVKVADALAAGPGFAKLVENLARLATFGWPDSALVRVAVDLASRDLFEIHPEYHRGNSPNHKG